MRLEWRFTTIETKTDYCPHATSMLASHEGSTRDIENRHIWPQAHRTPPTMGYQCKYTTAEAFMRQKDYVGLVLQNDWIHNFLGWIFDYSINLEVVVNHSFCSPRWPLLPTLAITQKCADEELYAFRTTVEHWQHKCPYQMGPQNKLHATNSKGMGCLPWQYTL